MSSESSNSEPAVVGDTVVSLQQFNQAMAQVAQMQQETMQNVRGMQEAINRISSSSPQLQPLSGAPSIPPAQFIPPSAVIPGFIKLAKPSLFTGVVKANVELWLFEVEQYLVAYGVSIDSQRVAFASGHFKGLALQWWQNHCIQHPGLTITWDQFKSQVRTRFQPIEASRTARVNLRALKQGSKSVEQYCSVFYEQLQLIHDMSESDKIENFLYGLNAEIFDEVDKRDPATLEDAIKYAQRMELRGKVRATKRANMYGSSYKQRSKFYNYNSYRPRSYTQERTTASAAQDNSTSSNSGTTPMELGNLRSEEDGAEDEELEQEWNEYLNMCEEEEEDWKERGNEEEVFEFIEEKEEEEQHLNALTNKFGGPKLQKEEFIRLRNEGRCFRCKQAGHWGRECPNSNRGRGPFRRGNKPQPRPSKS